MPFESNSEANQVVNTPDISAPIQKKVGSNRIWDVLWFLTFAIASSYWCVTAAWQLGATFDEPTYLENGLHFWRTGSHRQLMRLGTMPLPVDLQTLPLAIAERVRGTPWDHNADSERILPWMRHGNLVFWWLLLFMAFRIGNVIAAPWGGRLAMALIACEPNLLAHAALATTDISITATCLLFAYYFLRGRESTWWHRVGIPAICYGIALLSKASAMMFVPVMAATIELLRPGNKSLRLFVKDMLAIAFIGFGIALVGVGSDFQYEESFVKWAKGLPDGTAKVWWLWIAKHLKIFGNAGEGLVMQIKHNVRGHGQYLLGHESHLPYWYFFPVVFSIKLAVPVLFGAALAIIRPRQLRNNWPLVCAAVLLVFSLTCRVQLGIRLQLLAVVCLLIGVAVTVTWMIANSREFLRRPMALATACGVAWMAFACANIWPNGLCYINELWGGSKNGYQLVSDSNYDWGQGLPELARWQREHGNPSLDVWYFGVDPRLKRLPMHDLKLHILPVNKPEDTATFCKCRYLAVGTTLRYGFTLTDAQRRAVDYLSSRQPVLRHNDVPHL